jgi:hypothetical protein
MKVGVLVRRNSRNVDGVVQAANIANRLQPDFEFDVEQVDWLQKGNGELRPEDVVQKVKEKHAGRHLIVIISPPLKGDYLDYARRGMSIVSTAGWDSRFAPPPLAIYVTDGADPLVGFTQKREGVVIGRLHVLRMAGGSLSVIVILRQSVTSSARNVALRVADARRRARQLATENVGGQRKENKNDVARIERPAKKSHKG